MNSIHVRCKEQVDHLFCDTLHIYRQSYLAEEFQIFATYFLSTFMWIAVASELLLYSSKRSSQATNIPSSQALRSNQIAHAPPHQFVRCRPPLSRDIIICVSNGKVCWNSNYFLKSDETPQDSYIHIMFVKTLPGFLRNRKYCLQLVRHNLAFIGGWQCLSTGVAAFSSECITLFRLAQTLVSWILEHGMWWAFCLDLAYRNWFSSRSLDVD